MAFRRTALLLLLPGIAVSNDAAGQSGRWTAHTSMREVTALSPSSEGIWVGTTGGLFSYSEESGEIQRYTIAEGLNGIAVVSVAFDPGANDRGAAVWVGYGDGVLDRLATDGSIRTFRDIERATRFPNREISRLEVRGDSLLASTSFGLVIFDLALNEVRDSYTQLGAINPGTAVRDVIVAPGPDGADHFWLATEDGIARAPLAAPNLKDPAAWTVEQSGLPATSTHALAYFDGALYVGTDQGLVVRTVDGAYTNTGLSGTRVGDLDRVSDMLIATDGTSLIVVRAGGQGERFVDERFPEPVAVRVDDDGNVWLGDAQEGLVQLAPLVADMAPAVVQSILPRGPYHNQFVSLTTDAAGNVWAGGARGAGFGFYRLSPEGEWTNFIGREVEALQGKNSYTRIHAAPNGDFWAGSHDGHAVARVTPDGGVQIIDNTNSSLRGAEGSSPGFILSGGIGTDPDGRVWIASRHSNRPLNVRLGEDEWANLAFQDCPGVTSTTGTYDLLYVDTYGQKWIDIKARADLTRGMGLMVLDTRNTPANQSDDACRFFGETGAAGQGMPGLLVTSMIEDRSGLMWIGTDRGLAYFLNNGVIAQDPTATPIWPQHEDRSLGTFVFQGLAVNDVAVDPANQVWVATNEGAWLIRQSGAGFVLEENFTAANSPLLSNIVLAITVDERTGRVFMATDRGMASYSGDAIAASPESRDLFVYPNPARVGPDDDAAIFIEGLVEETEVMIVAPHGELIRRFMARGGRTRWDGRDESGRPVPSGMYLVVALGQSGEETAYGKLALIR